MCFLFSLALLLSLLHRGDEFPRINVNDSVLLQSNDNPTIAAIVSAISQRARGEIPRTHPRAQHRTPIIRRDAVRRKMMRMTLLRPRWVILGRRPPAVNRASDTIGAAVGARSSWRSQLMLLLLLMWLLLLWR
jgi:hypothetical protein